MKRPNIEEIEKRLNATQGPWEFTAASRQDISDLIEYIKHQESLLKMHCEEWADDDIKVKELAAKVLPKGFDEDDHMFVGVVDVVEKLVAEILTSRLALSAANLIIGQQADEVEKLLNKTEELT